MKSKSIKVAVVGATGMVGRSFLKILEEFDLSVEEYTLFASKKSAGKKIEFLGQEYIVEELSESSFSNSNLNLNKRFDYALFSAGAATSKRFAPLAAKTGCIVIDNSSCWRMNKEVPLVVPQVNLADIWSHKNIIANPNCSTIQAVVALAPLHKIYGIKRVIYSTYQAVSGAGKSGVDDLQNGVIAHANNINNSKFTNYKLTKFSYPIFGNCIPQIDDFLEDGYTKEEHKMIDETRKILNAPDLLITATTVRVPVFNSHCESINLELDSEFDLEEVKNLLKSSDGVVVEDDIKNKKYPMPIDVTGSDKVFVGRIRRDFSVKNGLNLWVVADNIRKGAATNAVEILKHLIINKYK